MYEAGCMVAMIQSHLSNNGGEPVPLDRISRALGYKSTKDKDFLTALSQNHMTGFLDFRYYRNKQSVKLTPSGEAFVRSIAKDTVM